MTISDFATLLLDDSCVAKQSIQLDLFRKLEASILAALEPEASEAASPAEPAPSPAKSYMVASRLGRANYEDDAKKEAILNALQSMRGNRGMNNGRVIRSS